MTRGGPGNSPEVALTPPHGRSIIAADSVSPSTRFPRRGVRVAEGARLESVCGGNLTVGSNPTLSAILPPPETAIPEVSMPRPCTAALLSIILIRAAGPRRDAGAVRGLQAGGPRGRGDPHAGDRPADGAGRTAGQHRRPGLRR